MENLKDKVALVTGGSQGYGRSIAEKLVKEGVKVIIAALGKESLEMTKMEIGCEDLLVMDVTLPEYWDLAAERILSKYGTLDILINNAGGAVKLKNVIDLSLEEIDSIIKLNLNSVVYSCRVFGKIMKKKRSGTILNIASVCATHAWPAYSVYGAAKAGVLEFSKGLYSELQPYGVRVTCMIPGAGATDFMKHAGAENMNVRLQAEDVAEAVVSVCRLPDHVVVEEMTLWGIDQAVIPF